MMPRTQRPHMRQLPSLLRAALCWALCVALGASLCFISGAGRSLKPCRGIRLLPLSRSAAASSAWDWPAWLPSLPLLGWRPASEAARALRDLLVESKKSGGQPLDPAQAAALIEEVAAAQVVFRPELLGNTADPVRGLWRAAYTQGPTPKWEENAKLLPFLQNRAGQAYDSTTGQVSNYGEVLGPAVYFTAEGSFRAVDGRIRCPKDYTVAIEQGGLVVLGVPLLSSAISGPGYLRCLYLDDDIRVFESPTDSPERWESAGLIVVQVREALFES